MLAFFGNSKSEAGLGEKDGVRGQGESGGGAPTGHLALCAAACVRPHPEKVAKGGEDSHCVRLPSPGSSTGGSLLAVCDGVSGASNQGADSAAYSRRLARCLADAALVADNAAADGTLAAMPQADSLNALAMLTAAHASTRLSGACTACVCVLDGKSKRMSTCNLGDSGWLVLRDGAIIARSSPQQHTFDCPYQLSSAKYVPNTDTPDMADTAVVELQQGDLVLLASDGLWDNTDMASILTLIAQALRSSGGDAAASDFNAARAVCDALTAAAYTNSQDDTFDSPYALAARAAIEAERAKARANNPFSALASAFGQESGGKWQSQGGKWDDISVVAALVVDTGTGAASLSAAREAAATALRVDGSGIASACGDATAESRRLYLGSTEADDAEELAARLAAKAAAKLQEKTAAASAAAASFKAAYTERDTLSMDAAACRTALAKANLPTSGKLDVLRARVLTISA